MNAQGLDQELLTLTSLSLSRSLFKVKIVPLPSRRRIYLIIFFLPDLKVQAPTRGAPLCKARGTSSSLTLGQGLHAWFAPSDGRAAEWHP